MPGRMQRNPNAIRKHGLAEFRGFNDRLRPQSRPQHVATFQRAQRHPAAREIWSPCACVTIARSTGLHGSMWNRPASQYRPRSVTVRRAPEDMGETDG